jgi:hypothetical protein
LSNPSSKCGVEIPLLPRNFPFTMDNMANICGPKERLWRVRNFASKRFQYSSILALKSWLIHPTCHLTRGICVTLGPGRDKRVQENVKKIIVANPSSDIWSYQLSQFPIGVRPFGMKRWSEKWRRLQSKRCLLENIRKQTRENTPR